MNAQPRALPRTLLDGEVQLLAAVHAAGPLPLAQLAQALGMTRTQGIARARFLHRHGALRLHGLAEFTVEPAPWGVELARAYRTVRPQVVQAAQVAAVQVRQGQA